jgi:hypothetical protein
MVPPGAIDSHLLRGVKDKTESAPQLLSAPSLFKETATRALRSAATGYMGLDP